MTPVQNPTTQADYYTDLPVGEILRRTRTHFGQSLDDAAGYLRIRASQLEALENNDLEQLPGRVYAIGYIRTYSEYLGLDGEKMVHLFKQQSGGKTSRPELHFPVPASESKAPNLYVIFGSLAVLGLVVGVWVALSSAGHVKNENIAEIPSVPAEMRAATSSTSSGLPEPTPVANETAQSGVAVAVAVDTSGNPALPVTAATPTPSVMTEAAKPQDVVAAQAPAMDTATQAAVTVATTAITTTPVPAETAAAAAVETPAVPAQKKEIVITIKDRSWVEVRDKAGKSILSRILKPGEVFIVPESNYGLRLDTGNAGGIELSVNGLPVQPLGKQGDILRGFVLDGNELMKKLEPASGATTTTTAPAVKVQ